MIYFLKINDKEREKKKFENQKFWEELTYVV